MDAESRGYGGLIYNFVICRRRRCGSACLVISPSTYYLTSTLAKAAGGTFLLSCAAKTLTR